MPELRLYNTLTRNTDLFTPISSDQVGLYCCGPTVYNYQHIGNLRTYIFEDILARTLRYAGYSVKHVMNITDVGHLVSDADEGEDKMLLAVRREGKTSAEIAAYYTEIFFEHCRWLNIVRPDVVCKATEHIEQMIHLIQELEEKEFAYQSGGNVYFDVERFEEYGKLARLNVKELIAGARIEVDSHKKNPLDFALWFTQSKFEGQELQWDSPWGRGYPGWHIECSAMARSYLGDSFDIHCGGIDHIPVHHTNEIAQSEGASGIQCVNVWMHGGFLVLGKDKMSKSSGEFLTLDLLKERGFDPICYRLFCLSGSYRQELSWSWQALEAAANTLSRLQNTVQEWQAQIKAGKSCPITEKDLSEHAQQLKQAFEREIFNDLSIPAALAVLHQVTSDRQLSPGEKIFLFHLFDRILGLGVEQWGRSSEEIPPEVQTLVLKREQARQSKDWAAADRLRDELLELGYAVEDHPEGSRLKRLRLSAQK